MSMLFLDKDVEFQHGDTVYHSGRGQTGEFLGYSFPGEAEVCFDDDTELTVSVGQLSLAD